MLIKTLLLFALTFAISTVSMVNTVRDIFVVRTEAAQVQEAYVVTAEVAEVNTVYVETTAETEPQATEETVPTIVMEETQVPIQETVPETEPEVEIPEETAPETEPEIEIPETVPETQPYVVVKDEDYWYDFWANLHYGELTKFAGYIVDGPAGPNGNDGYETWYDLDMTLVVQWLDEYFEKKGLEDGCDYSDYKYHVDHRGIKMYGPYIIVAGDIVNTRNRYDIVECSLGTAIVADYCEKAVFSRPYQLDIATTWGH